MIKQARGIYREKGGWGPQDSAHVTDGTLTMDVSEAKYRESGYQPPFEKLPWKPEYEASQKRDADPNQLAKGIIDKATDESPKDPPQREAKSSKADNKPK
jgi:hypothetical protein